MMQWLLLSNGQLWLADYPISARPFANFGQPNTLATFLSIGLMGVLYLYEKKYINQVSGVLIACLLIFGIALTQSRTSWVYAVMFILWWLWKKNNFKTRIVTYHIITAIGFYIFCIILLPILSDLLDVAITKDAFTRATTGLNRVAMWYQMIIAIENQPWLGYGWNQVGIAQVMTTIEYPIEEWTEHAHNIILDLLIWNGIPLGLTIIGLLVWWLYSLSKLVTNIESFIALSMVGAVLVHAMLEYPLEYAFFLLPVGFLLGLVQAQNKSISTFIIPQYISLTIMSILVVIYIWVFIEYRIIEKDVQLARFESFNIGTLHAKQAAPDVILLSQLREQIRFIRTQPTENMSDEKLKWMQKVAYRYATPTALFRYAQALALNNKLNLAKEQLLIIDRLHGKKFSEQSLYIVTPLLSFEWEGERKVSNRFHNVRTD